MENRKVYFPEVDAVKGIAILLVILGHSFCVYPVDLDTQFTELGTWVRSFQMPLFFIASGFVYRRTASMGELAGKKCRRLFVPWLAFSVLSLALRVVFSSFTHHGAVDVAEALWGIVQGRSYWFLYSLMCLLLLCQLVRRDWALWLLAAASVALGLWCDLPGFEPFTLGRTAYYLPFFVFGTLLRRKIEGGGNSSCLRKPKVYAWVAVFLLCYVGLMAAREAWRGIPLYAVPLAGSLLVWGVACLCTSTPVQRVLAHFGRYSLQYYLNHLLIMLPFYILASKLPVCPLAQLLLIWTLGTAASWAMLMVQKKVKVFRMICGLLKVKK